MNSSQNDYIQKLYSLANSKRVNNKDLKKSHTMIGPPFGTYFISDDDYINFIEIYNKVIQTKTPLYYVERPKDVGLFFMDLDFDFLPKEENQYRRYSEKHIEKIVHIINKIIKKYIDVKKKNINAYIVEKPKPTVVYDKNKSSIKRYKDGLHIFYPDIPLHYSVRYFLIDKIENEVKKRKILEDIPFINSIDNVFDRCIVMNNGVIMYGSKKPDGAKYELSYVLNYNLEKKEVDTTNLPFTLSNRRYKEGDEYELKDEISDDDMALIESYINNKNNSKEKKNNEKPKKETKEIKKDNNDIDYKKDFLEFHESSDVMRTTPDENDNTRKLSKDEFIKIKKLISILNPKRAYDYDTWTQVGWCLRNINIGLLELFKYFSKEKLREYLEKYPGENKYEESSCIKLWTNARESGTKLTIASLHHWARTDNPTKYAEILRESVREDLKQADSGTHYDVALVMFKLYRHQFVCSSINKKTWYQFQKHRWVPVERGYTLSLKMSSSLTDEFMNVMRTYYAESAGKDGVNRDMFMQKGDKIRKLIDKLKTKGFKDAVMDECSQLFYDAEFEEKLDSNKDIIGFDNGVYDLETGQFRDGVPEDYLTFSTNYNYKSFSMNHPYINQIDDFFSKVQPDKAMKEYILSLFSSHLDGHNKQQRFILFTGYGGSNGKSTIIDYLAKLLGDYASTVPHTLLTRKRGSASNATPELADKRGVRFIQINETGKDDKIDVGYMKELTGNDVVMARPLFKDPFYFRPQWKFVLICNKLPKIEANDGGTWRRLRVTPFDVQFLDTDQKIENPKMQFYKDYGIEDKLEMWKQAGIWYLLKKYYPKYRKLGVTEPDKVKEFTNKYRKECDLYDEYLNETFDLTRNNMDTVSIKEIGETFRDWYRESYYGGGSMPSKKEIVSYLETRGFRISGRRVFGLRHKEIDDDMGDMGLFQTD